MNESQTLSFVECPNPDHIGKEGWSARQLYYAGNGVFKCASCDKEFTREEVRDEIIKEYQLRIRDLHQDYQQSLAKLYKDNQDDLKEFYAIIDAS